VLDDAGDGRVHTTPAKGIDELRTGVAYSQVSCCSLLPRKLTACSDLP
jgi:hypothetical protein